MVFETSFTAQLSDCVAVGLQPRVVKRRDRMTMSTLITAFNLTLPVLYAYIP